MLASIETLAFQPRPRRSQKLTGSESSYRIRVGDYRILYEVDDQSRIVSVFAIGHRREVYR
jgi:mRNA interferase RelE/StbE